MSERLQLTLVPGSFDDWFVLHGGANWASIEGNAEEWREVADALEAGKDVRRERRAVLRGATSAWPRRCATASGASTRRATPPRRVTTSPSHVARSVLATYAEAAS